MLFELYFSRLTGNVIRIAAVFILIGNMNWVVCRGQESTGYLSREKASELAEQIWRERTELIREQLEKELEAAEIVVGGHGMKILEREFGAARESGHSLYISLHGGGGAPARVNDQQWQNQIRLYEPEEGYYVAPRAPTNNWNLWHEPHIDGLFDRLILAYVVCRGVNPDRVYLMGYSAGGDGVYQLSPRMSDRFAAAAMMAGHPNETRPEGLRNIPFALFMGGKDGAYDRNRIAGEWEQKLAELQEKDPDGYPHMTRIYPDHGHWMQGEDREALPWMAEKDRCCWPKKIVWVQDDVTHNRLYWIGVPADAAKGGDVITASVNAQSISIQSENCRKFVLYLHDDWIDLDREISVIVNGNDVFSGKIKRTRQSMERSLNERMDRRLIASAVLELSLDVGESGQ